MPQASRPPSASLQSLPKVDLHRHLEGSLRLPTVAELAAAGAIPLPSNEDELRRLIQVGPGDPHEREFFLSRFASIREVFRSEEIVDRVASEAVLDAAADNVRYLELHLTPAALSARNSASYADVIRWVLRAVRRTATSENQVNLVVSINRHEPVSVAEAVVEAAVDHRESGVVALDLAGDEGEYSAEPFREVFREAGEAGLHLSVHAGEWSGPQSVREAIESLGAERVSHGVRIMEDRDVVRLARDRGVPFAVCLTSNVQTGVVADPLAHPLLPMIQAGLHVTLNTDDPGLSGISLSTEYARALELGLTEGSLRGLIMAGLEASFLPERAKKALEAPLLAQLGLAPKSDAQ